MLINIHTHLRIIHIPYLRKAYGLVGMESRQAICEREIKI